MGHSQKRENGMECSGGNCFFSGNYIAKKNQCRNAYVIARKSWEADFSESRRKILDVCEVFCLTRKKVFNIPKEEQGKSCNSFDHALSEINKLVIPREKVFICGGLELYKEAFLRKLVDQCILSFLPDDYHCDMHLNFVRDNLESQFYKAFTDKNHKNFYVEYWKRKIASQNQD